MDFLQCDDIFIDCILWTTTGIAFILYLPVFQSYIARIEN